MIRTATVLAGIVFSAATATAGIAPAPLDKSPAPPADPCAGPISYTNIELLYERTDFDGNNRDDGDAGVVRFEWGTKQNLYFTFDADRNSYDYTTEGIRDQTASWSIDQWKVSAGIGGHIELTDNIHLSGDAGIIYTDIDANRRSGGFFDAQSPDDSETGWFIRPQIRAKFGCWTIHAGGTYQDFGGEDEWTVYGRVYYQIAPKWDLTLGFSTGDEANVYSGGIRWRF